MVAIFDIDSLVYQSCFSAEDLDEAAEGFYGRYDHALFNLQKRYNLDKIVPVGFCTNNYRHRISLTYKAHRSDDKPPFFNELVKEIRRNMNVVTRSGIETDDLVAKLWLHYGPENAIIVSIDKDYRQFPCIMYNYMKDEVEVISEEDAYYNFMEQMVCGDRADNIKPLKGYGPKWCEKNLLNKSKWAILRAVYSLYKKKYHSKAKEVFMNTYYLLKLDAI